MTSLSHASRVRLVQHSELSGECLLITTEFESDLNPAAGLQHSFQEAEFNIIHTTVVFNKKTISLSRQILNLDFLKPKKRLFEESLDG